MLPVAIALGICGQASAASIDKLYWTSIDGKDIAEKDYSDTAVFNYKKSSDFTAEITADQDAKLLVLRRDSISRYYADNDISTWEYTCNTSDMLGEIDLDKNYCIAEEISIAKGTKKYEGSFKARIDLLKNSEMKLALITPSATKSGASDTVYSKNELSALYTVLLEVSSTENGTTTNAAKKEVLYGTKESFAATPNKDYEFACWANSKNECINSQPKTEIWIFGDTAITALYRQNVNALKVNITSPFDSLYSITSRSKTYSNLACSEKECDIAEKDTVEIIIDKPATFSKFDIKDASNKQIASKQTSDKKKILFEMPATPVTLTATIAPDSITLTYDKANVRVYNVLDPKTTITRTTYFDTIVVAPIDENHAFKTYEFNASDGTTGRYYEEFGIPYNSEHYDYKYTYIKKDYDIVATLDTAYKLSSAQTEEDLCSFGIYPTIANEGKKITLVGYTIVDDSQLEKFECKDEEGNDIDLDETEILTSRMESSFTMPASSVTCGCIAKKNVHTITYTATSKNGTFTAETKEATYGDVIKFTVKPKEGYKFSYDVCNTDDQGVETCWKYGLFACEEKDDNYQCPFEMLSYDRHIKLNFNKIYEVKVPFPQTQTELMAEIAKGSCSLDAFPDFDSPDIAAEDSVSIRANLYMGTVFEKMECKDKDNNPIELTEPTRWSENEDSPQYSKFLMPESDVTCTCQTSFKSYSLSSSVILRTEDENGDIKYTAIDDVKIKGLPDSAKYRSEVSFSVDAGEKYYYASTEIYDTNDSLLSYISVNYFVNKARFTMPHENVKVVVYLKENPNYKENDNGEKESIVLGSTLDAFHVNVVKNNILISGIKAGSNIAVLDLQGRIITTSRASSSMANVMVPRAGNYLVKVGSKIQTVTVK